MSGELDFWARRRAGVAAEAEADRAAAEAQLIEEQHAELDDLSDAEILAKLELPDPDTLVQGDDFSVFMSKAVPDQIRRRALRTLWRSNPVLANVDMLVDYGEDFTDAAMAVENIQTAYQVGKGMLKHVQEMARQAEERANPPAPEDETQAEDEVLSAQADALDADTVEVSAALTPDPIAEFEQEEDDSYASPTPRRMKFKVEEPA